MAATSPTCRRGSIMQSGAASTMVHVERRPKRHVKRRDPVSFLHAGACAGSGCAFRCGATPFKARRWPLLSARQAPWCPPRFSQRMFRRREPLATK